MIYFQALIKIHLISSYSVTFPSFKADLLATVPSRNLLLKMFTVCTVEIDLYSFREKLNTFSSILQKIREQYVRPLALRRGAFREGLIRAALRRGAFLEGLTRALFIPNLNDRCREADYTLKCYNSPCLTRVFRP